MSVFGLCVVGFDVLWFWLGGGCVVFGKSSFGVVFDV